MTEPGFCSTCGASVRLTPRPGRVRRLRDWFFLDDRHRGDRFECENGHGWTSSSHVYFSRTPRPSVLGVVSEIAGHRTISPVPATYAIAAGAGLFVGFGTRALLGWRWWPAAFLGPLAAWLAAAATAFGRENRDGTMFAIRNQLDPAGATERHIERRRRHLSRMSFPVYGLAHEEDSASLGGFARSGEQVYQVTVAYGDVRNENAPVVEVTTSSRAEPLGYLQHEEEEGLRIDAAGPSHLESSDPSVYRLEIHWAQVDVTIDGVSHSGVVAELRDVWSVLVADVAGGSVIIRGRNTEVRRPLTLTVVELQESMM